jgi:hypothetical protein
VAAFQHSAWAVSIYTAVFGVGLLSTATFAVVQSMRSRGGAREVGSLVPEPSSGGGGS